MATMPVLSLFRGIKSKSWPSMMGEITSSQVLEYWDTDTETRTTSLCHKAQIRYRYPVGVSFYESERVNSGQITGGDQGKKHSERLVAKYYEGQKVRVYYNPKNPQLSVIEPGVAFNFEFYLEVILGFIIMPACIFLVYWTSPSTTVPWVTFGFSLCLGATSAYFVNRLMDKEKPAP